nr:MAG: putative cysteine protease [Lake Baikal virophage 16]
MDIINPQETRDDLVRTITEYKRRLIIYETAINDLVRTITQYKRRLQDLKKIRGFSLTTQEWDAVSSEIDVLSTHIENSENTLNHNKESLMRIQDRIKELDEIIKRTQIEQRAAAATAPAPAPAPAPPARPPFRFITREERERERRESSGPTTEPVFVINSPGAGSSNDPPLSGSGLPLDLDKLKEYALSDEDIEELLGEDIFICVYPYLNEVEHIDQIFDDKGRCMLLFNTINDSAGHWVCMHKKKDRIDFFDPYGLKPDEPMKWLTEQKRDDLDMETRRLTQLLKSSGYKVYYNTFEFQSDKHSNTCGRWCATRLLKLNLNLDQFYKFINDYKNKYELGTLENTVTYLTYEIINK